MRNFAMGGWFSALKGDAAPPDTPAPAKLFVSDLDEGWLRTQQQPQGARAAPAARALSASSEGQRMPSLRAPEDLGSGVVPLVSHARH